MKHVAVANDRKKWYDTLGLRPGATPDEIKTAYRDLVKVWHPDRFHGDARVREKAEEKLKDINEAYQALLPAVPGPESPPNLQTDAPPDLLPGFDPFGRESRASRIPWAPSPHPEARPRPHPGAPPRPHLDTPARPIRRPKLPGARAVFVSLVLLSALAASVALAPTLRMMAERLTRPPLATTVSPSVPAQAVPAAPPQPPAVQSPSPGSPSSAPPAAQAQPAAGPSPSAAANPTAGRPADAYDSVVMLVTVRPFRPHEYATAFLVDRTTAITTSHAVIDAAQRGASLTAVTPDYHAFRARVICRVRPSNGQPDWLAEIDKDVALVQIDWNSPIRALKISGQAMTPEAPPLAITPLSVSRTSPRVGERIMIVGYGRQRQSVPRQLREIGEITSVGKASDGTAIFSARFAKRPVAGEGGAPVLNRAGEVVGIWAWEAMPGTDDGGGVAVPSLTCP